MSLHRLIAADPCWTPAALPGVSADNGERPGHEDERPGTHCPFAIRLFRRHGAYPRGHARDTDLIPPTSLHAAS